MQLPKVSQIQTSPRPMAQFDVAGMTAGAYDNIRRTSAVANAALDTVSDVDRAVDEARRIRIENQKTRASYNMTSEMRRLERELSSRDFYEPDEVPEGIGVRVLENTVDETGNVVQVPRSQIPAHEVNPALFRKGLEGFLVSYSGEIEDDNERQMWEEKARMIVDGAFHQMQMQTIAKQQEEFREMSINNIAAAMDEGNYDIARMVADSGVFSDTQRQEIGRQINTREEMDLYDSSISENDIDLITGSLVTLRADEYNGHLNESQRLTYVNRLASALEASKKASAVSNKVDMQRLKRTVERTINAIESGYNVNGEELSTTIERIRAASVLFPDEMTQYSDRLHEAVGFMPQMTQFVRMNDYQRQKVLANMRTKDLTADQSHMLDVFTRADSNIGARISKDVYALGADVGLVPVSPVPSMSDPEAFSQWLSTRQRGKETLENAYGFGSFMTVPEREIFEGNMKRMSSYEKLNFMSMVAESLTDSAPEFWQEFSKMDGGVTYIAGSVYRDDPVSARKILEGLEFMKSDSYKKPPQTDMAMMQDSYISSAYGIGSQRDAVLNATEAVYAYLSREVGEYDAYSRGVDQGRYKKALTMVTGGLVEVGGKVVVPPVRGMQERDFDNYINNVPSEWFESNGGVQGYRGQYEDLRQNIRDGIVSLVAVGNNEYLLKSELEGVDAFLLREDNLQPFVFKYDHTAKLIKRNVFGKILEGK